MAIPPPPEGPPSRPQSDPAAGGQSYPPGGGPPHPYAQQPHPHPHPHSHPSPGQQPPPPYGGWPGAQPYGYVPQPPPVNGLAIAALVLGILCFLPLVGLILGVLALSQINKRGERGKGLAVAGIALSAIGAVLLSVSLVTGAAGEFVDGFREGMDEARESSGPFSLEKGQCFDVPGGRMSGQARNVDVVSCEEPHDGEVFGSFRLSGDKYPGESRIKDMADARCSSLADTYVGDPAAVGDEVYLFFYGPTRASYLRGDREVSCILHKENGKLTGSLRDAGRDDGGSGGTGGGSGGGDGGSAGTGGGVEDGPGPGREV
ncbi:hypothetical protein DSC45_16835 [Streptomyces sp. YIM 130001]|uniref:DUF4190 domain-containing protein n=1 Tax=Streptomyces sp. YIM 130001 TaxID=2259644 RepID=UPI000E64FC7F|nr:DUF4190 domain-containing protein [Streptomyces sp. YIM 130001]RII15909.1 hypothetical protein DSC45_16835 [Streptomyces sp. YIM 130001]